MNLSVASSNVLEIKKASHFISLDRDAANRSAFLSLLNPFELLSGKRKKRRGEVAALSEIDLTLEPGKSLGIVCGNDICAQFLVMMVSGMLRPHEGSVTMRGTPLLFNSPGKVFKPMLTVREAAEFVLVVSRVPKVKLQKAVDATLQLAGLQELEHKLLYDLSSEQMKQLGFAAMLNATADFYVFYHILRAGQGPTGDKIYARALERISEQTAIVFHSDEMLLKDLCDQVFYLPGPRLSLLRNMQTSLQFSLQGGMDDEDELGDDDISDEREDLEIVQLAKLETKALLSQCRLDGVLHHYNQVCHLVKVGETLVFDFELEPSIAYSVKDAVIGVWDSLRRQFLGGFQFSISQCLGGSEGELVKLVPPNRYRFSLSFEIPPLVPGEYGVTMEVSRGDNQERDLYKLYRIGVAGSTKGMAGSVQFKMLKGEISSLRTERRVECHSDKQQPENTLP